MDNVLQSPHVFGRAALGRFMGSPQNPVGGVKLSFSLTCVGKRDDASPFWGDCYRIAGVMLAKGGDDGMFSGYPRMG